MQTSSRPSVMLIARRVAARVLSRARRDPLFALALPLLAALLILFGPFGPDSGPAAASPPRDAAEQYMRALRDRDAAELLQSLSLELRAGLEQTSGQQGLAAAVALFAVQEQSGQRVLGYEPIGGYATAQGDQLRFYVLRLEQGGQQRDIPYTFTISQDGVITKIE